MPERKRLAALVALALIALGTWRLVAIVSASPMLGYANQFDMRRTSACVGLWPAFSPEERLQAHPEAPIARYVRGEKRPDECYLSTELVFVSAAVAVAALGNGSVDLRVLGAIEAAALVLAALALHAVFSHRPKAALTHVVVFALVICDPMNSLWLNTLYTEFSALFFAYVSIALLVAIAARGASHPARGPVRSTGIDGELRVAARATGRGTREAGSAGNYESPQRGRLLAANSRQRSKEVKDAGRPTGDRILARNDRRGRDGQRPTASPVAVGFFAASLVGLGLSRQQHFLLPALIALPALLSLARPARRAALALLAVVCAIAVVQLAVIGRHPTIVSANNADVVLGALLPASKDEARTAERLGLPARCLQSVGATWYRSMGETLESACPEVMSIPRGRLAAVVMSEPATSLRALLRGIPQLQDWRLGYLGAVEGERFAGAERVRAIAGPAAASAAPWVTALDPPIFVWLLACSLALFVVSAGVSFTGGVRGNAYSLALVLYALTGSAAYAIATSIFGDGYVEVSRHAQLAAPCLYAAAIVLVASLFAALVSGTGESRRTALAAGMIGAAALGIGTLLWIALSASMREVPMALGVVDRPARNSVPPAPLEFAGWALEPSRVARVELVTQDGTAIQARYGLPYVGARGEALRLYFPAYPDVDAAGFVAELPAEALARGALDVRTVVVGKSGTRTEIDRRRIVVERR